MYKYVVHRNVVDGSRMIGIPLSIVDSEWDMPWIEPGPLGWHTSALTNELQEVRLVQLPELWNLAEWRPFSEKVGNHDIDDKSEKLPVSCSSN